MYKESDTYNSDAEVVHIKIVTLYSENYQISTKATIWTAHLHYDLSV